MDLAPTAPIALPETVRSRYFTVRFARWLGRTAARMLRWLRRHFIKITLWTATLITLAWQYENWHGPRALTEQRRLWVEEYGEMKWDDFTPPRVPDAENFFAAPVFETFVMPGTPSFPKDSRYIKAHEAAQAMPHARFLHMKFPELKMCEGLVPDKTTAPGLKTLDVAAWAAEQRKAGKAPDTTGTSDAAWLHASMPEDETVSGFVAALSRPRAALLPHTADRWAIGKELKDPAAIPLPEFRQCFQVVTKLSLRARAAARAGDAVTARNLTEVISRLQTGFATSSSLVGHLVAAALEGPLLDAVSEGVAVKCWQDADLSLLAASLEKVDEEKPLFNALNLEGFGLHMWPREDIVVWLRDVYGSSRDWQSGSPEFRMEAAIGWISWNGPAGWTSANLSNHLLWWRMLMIPNGPGDDLLALSKKLSSGLRAIQEISKTTVSPRDILARMALPNMSGIAQNALQLQTRRRQMLLAIAAERFALARGNYPATAAELVPDFLPAIPSDPSKPGSPLRYESGTPGERYRLVSEAKDSTMAMPVALP